MAKITVSAAVPQRRELRGIDESGETFVMIRPPGLQERLSRGRLVSKQFSYYNADGAMVTGIDCNPVDLAIQEIWLTYENASLIVEIESEEGTETISFEPRDKITYQDFMAKLNKVGSASFGIISEWHLMVLDVVPGWRNPF